MEHRSRRRLGFIGLAAAVLLVGVGCEPLVNAPPGGGATVTRTFRYGPFTIGSGGQINASPSSGLPRPTGSFGLKGARFDLVDQNGVAYDPHEVHLHHIVMTTTARSDALCPGRAERFIGAGMERTPFSLWGPYAYLVGANDPWGAIYHIMNMNPPNSPALTVYIQYTLDYQPGANATNSRPVQPQFQDVTGCGGSTYQVPGNGGPGSFHYNSRSWTAQRDGMVVWTGGHLHDGGINNTLKDDTTGTRICKSEAKYHHPDEFRHAESISWCALHEKVVAGHSYKLTSKYDNGEPWVDVMGINLTYVWWGTQ